MSSGNDDRVPDVMKDMELDNICNFKFLPDTGNIAIDGRTKVIMSSILGRLYFKNQRISKKVYGFR
mgnify:CR=1 FL=1